MLRIKQLVPTIALTLATATLLAPAAQARPAAGPFGSSPVAAQSVQNVGSGAATVPVHDTPLANPVSTATVPVHDTPLANPVSTPDLRGQGLIHSSTVNSQVGAGRSVSTSGDSFDWTAAAIGAGVAGLIMVMLAGGVTIRRRGQFAT